jgi:hemerythrin
MTLEWKDSYRVGHADIDTQHYELFRLAAMLFTCETHEMRLVHANSLSDHTRNHFTHEESLMRSLHFPEIDAHIAEHKLLLLRLDEIARDIAAGVLKGNDLEVFVSDWLVTHMTTSDVKLSSYVKS